MRFGPVNYNHEERCSQGHSSASTIATIEAALSADPDIDNSAIEIRMLGPVVLLEGFINKAADRDKAISLAAMIVGWENVGPGMRPTSGRPVCEAGSCLIRPYV
ncbi:BON domain-containing protein [Rhizobium ruizarguesonis]|uniref:BON domain-containing protein n=1 Tax=Rhizobium ruizarguesonis TaxID=2081791 RepID=UPI001FE15DBD|nr:BON domain-containing protein [Rhizobium ruizarguesonis]